jgi:hypothetical protein
MMKKNYTRIVAKATLKNQTNILNNHNLNVVMLGLVRVSIIKSGMWRLGLYYNCCNWFVTYDKWKHG